RILVPPSPFIAANLCSLISEAGKGLECMHRHKVVHNDVKAANILVFSGGPGTARTAKVTDLGLA
ncbi:unnamed protein product, partial [Laminaria digitata]